MSNWNLQDIKNPKMRAQAREQLDEYIRRFDVSEVTEGGRLNLDSSPTFAIRYDIPSRNALDSAHWATRRKLKDEAMAAILEAGLGTLRPVTSRVWLTITRVLGKHQKPFDEDNLIGGCKQLIDAMVSCGWFKDDGPDYLTISVDQDRSRRKEGPITEIHVRRAP